jgi:hypothetical protein
MSPDVVAHARSLPDATGAVVDVTDHDCVRLLAA